MYLLSHYALLAVLSSSIVAAAQVSGLRVQGTRDKFPTPVSGESWLTHLSRPFDETSMGKTGALGPGVEDHLDQLSSAPSVAPPPSDVAVSGADLYRLNCRGCHGAEGLGAPPEINSVVNPVKGTSVPFIVERMKSRGLDISPSAAHELAREATLSLLKRLHEGGESMPSFSYLTEPEIASIVAYLNQLADVPGTAKAPRIVRESQARIGELLVKSTCHICHGANGANPSEQQLWAGHIPPLEVLPSRLDQPRFIRKINHGLPIYMGDPPAFYRGRMPVLYYITAQEAADAYLYLTYYPPANSSRSIAVASVFREPLPPAAMGGDPPRANTEAQDRLLETHPADGLPTGEVLSIAGLFGFVVVLSLGGFAFTIHEFSRVSRVKPQSLVPNISPSERQPEETPLTPRMNAVELKPFQTT